MKNLEVTMTAVLTREELVTRATALQPQLREHAAKIEADRRVPEEVIDLLADAGMFKLSTPKRYGGYESGMRAMLDVLGCARRGRCLVVSGSSHWSTSATT